MDNPEITAADVINDVEGRFSSDPNLSSSKYFPWISYAYLRTYQALTKVNQTAKEVLFGSLATLTLTTDTPNEYTITDEIPRFGGLIKIEIKYGATGDVYNPAGRLLSLAHWNNQDNVSTTYRSKTTPLYYLLGTKLGFIPVPPESGATAKVWYIKRPYQIQETSDIIDIPYRFIWPVFEYVHAKALQAVNEDYATAAEIEANFRGQLGEVQESVASEFNENDGTDSIQDSINSPIYDDPLKW